MGGNELSAYGLCHLGDYEATVFSEHSQNRRFGEMFIKGKSYGKLAEGYYTAKALVELADKYGVEIPISKGVYNILYNGADPKSELEILFTRSLTQEY
jgi:glycerol-3-phosphate dehydrogenase (NAD(P)+)